jgi:hypothetical protein
MLVALCAAGVVLTAGAGATTGKAVPTCKAGQKSTKAHPCTTPVKKKTTKPSKPKTTPVSNVKPTGTTPHVATTPGAGPGVGVGGGQDADGCPIGQGIPQNGGDFDEDNNGGPTDGDGCT